MKLAASNIGWAPENDEAMYAALAERGFAGLEIAPTRLFPELPYEHCREAADFAAQLKKNYSLEICSMQSIWYGKQGRIAGSREERQELLDYTRQAIAFADAAGCRNLVFGCPRNRTVAQPGDEAVLEEFFLNIADLARPYGVCIALEANPPIYNTNYLNRTDQALQLLQKLAHPALGLNLDLGTVLANAESLAGLPVALEHISHVHISEPGLKKPEEHPQQPELAGILREGGYGHFVSLEMSRQPMTEVLSVLDRIKDIFA